MIYANAFKEKFKLVDGLIPEELTEASGESGKESIFFIRLQREKVEFLAMCSAKVKGNDLVV